MLCIELRRALTPVLAQPSAREQPVTTRRPRQKRPPVTTPRRSVRIAKRRAHGSKATKQQAVLIRRLCLANEAEVIGDAALQAYAQLFQKPLTDSHISAILALFGWTPEVLPLQEDMVVAADGQ